MATGFEEQVRARLKQLRFERRLSVRALAAAAGLSPSTLSRLENGERRLNLAQIAQLARAMRVEPQTLLGDISTAPPTPASDGRLWEPVGPQRTSGRHVFRIAIPPAGEPDLHSHPGHQWLYVLDGRVRLIIEGNEYTLTRGDAAEFETWRPHWLGAVGRTAQALAIFSPQGQPLKPISPR